MPGWLLKILRFLITVLVPVVLSLTAVRAMLSPWYLEFEYRTPMFPDDYYGFTMDERLAYGRVAVEYLVNDAGIEFLGDLRFPEGQETPAPSFANMVDCTYMYNDRELEQAAVVASFVSHFERPDEPSPCSVCGSPSPKQYGQDSGTDGYS